MKNKILSNNNNNRGLGSPIHLLLIRPKDNRDLFPKKYIYVLVHFYQDSFIGMQDATGRYLVLYIVNVSTKSHEKKNVLGVWKLPEISGRPVWHKNKRDLFDIRVYNIHIA